MKARQEHCIKEGRGGKGSLYVWAGGNGGFFDDNMNYDGYANSRYTISVGAVNEAGRPAYYRYGPPPTEVRCGASEFGRSSISFSLLRVCVCVVLCVCVRARARVCGLTG
jgi:hypothetical protein